MTPGQLTQVVAPGTFNRPQNSQQDPQGWYGEETLDIEAVHGMAPAAKIVYVGAPNNCHDLDAALNHVVDRHLAQIVTNSYGYATELLPPGYVKPSRADAHPGRRRRHRRLLLVRRQRRRELATSASPTTDFPASSPWVTAVGGTALGISQANTRALETGWGTCNYTCNTTTLACTAAGWLYGSGGGVSQIFAKPSYQSGLSATGSGGARCRRARRPADRAPRGADADVPRRGRPTVSTASAARVSSVQIFAGLMALADQAAGAPHGFANPLFYAHPEAVLRRARPSRRRSLAATSSTASTPATGRADFLRTFDDYSGSPSQHTGPGWDNVTGLGTPGEDFLATFGQ